MGLIFGNKIVYGVSVTPGIGIEVAQIDYERRLLVNYVSKPFEFDARLVGTGFDLDIFKETLLDALVEIGAARGSEIVLTLPTTIFKVNDWPASMDQTQIINNIEDDILDTPQFQNEPGEPSYSFCALPNSTIQFNKIVYTALHKSLVLEIALQISNLKYKLLAIDTSLNSSLNALIYSGRVNVAPDSSWVMLVVDNNFCRVIPMLGRNYVDCIEEKINIGRVLEDAENYDIVVDAVNPIINNTPSSLLYVISKTDLISAKILADKLQYKSQIVHMEANAFNNEPLIDIAVDLDPEKCRLASLDVIGSGIRKGFLNNISARLNLFNPLLGDVYTSQVPPVLFGVELSTENTLKIGLLLAVIILAIAFGISYYIKKMSADSEAKIQDLDNQIAVIDKFLEENKDISTEKFSESNAVAAGLSENKNIYSYYTIVGTEIPKKLWLTSLDIGEHVTIEGQADNLESVYSFFRNIKDYNPESPVKLQKLGLAGKPSTKEFAEISGDSYDTESVLTSLNADFYEFKISDVAEVPKNNNDNNNDNNKATNGLPANLEPIEE